jgi:hypothetical protein
LSFGSLSLLRHQLENQVTTSEDVPTFIEIVFFRLVARRVGCSL